MAVEKLRLSTTFPMMNSLIHRDSQNNKKSKSLRLKTLCKSWSIKTRMQLQIMGSSQVSLALAIEAKEILAITSLDHLLEVTNPTIIKNKIIRKRNSALMETKMPEVKNYWMILKIIGQKPYLWKTQNLARMKLLFCLKKNLHSIRSSKRAKKGRDQMFWVKLIELGMDNFRISMIPQYLRYGRSLKD